VNQQLIKSLLIEIDASTEKLRRELRAGGVELERFEGKAKQGGKSAASGADAMISKQASAARQIAMTTETIARQGKITGEAAKQGIAHASNMAFAFGPTGAIVGAIGISTLAIVSMFTRVRREMEETNARGRDMMRQFAEMDVTSQAAALQRLYTGDAAAAQESFGSLRELPDEERRARLRARGTERLRRDIAALEARRIELGTAPIAGLSSDQVRARSREQRANAEFLDEARAALDELSGAIERQTPILQANAAAQARRAIEVEKNAKAGKADAEATRAAAKEQEAMDRFAQQLGETSDQYRERLYSEFTRALTEGFKGTRAEIEAAFAQLVQVAEETGEQAEIPVLVNARDRALELRDLLDAVESQLSSGAFNDFWDDVNRTESGGLSGPYAAELDSLRALRDEAVALSSDERRSAKDHETAMKTAVSLQARISALVDEGDKTQEKVKRSLADQAREVAFMVDGVLQLAGAWGNVNRETIDILRNLNMMVSAVPGLLDKLKALKTARAANGGTGEGVGLAQLNVVGAALPIIGAVAGIANTLFGESPAEAERKRVQRENTAALRELTKKVGLLGLDVTGTEARASFGNASRLRAAAAARLAELDPTGLGVGRNQFQLREFAARRGFDFDELQKVANDFGITLQDRGVDSLDAFLRALEENIGKLGEFGDSLADGRTLADARIIAQGITDPIEKLLLRSSPAQQLSPLIKQLVDGADLSNAAARERIREEIAAIIETMAPGGAALTPEQMGGLTADEFLQELLAILSGLEDIGSAAGGAVGTSLGGISGFRGLTEAAGERMGDYLRALTEYARTAEGQRAQTLSVLQAQLQYLAAVAGTPLQAPPVPGTFGTGRAGAATTTPLYVTIGDIHLGGITLQMPEGSNGTDAAEAVMRVAGRSISQVMYDAILQAQKVAGDLSVTPRIR
jgi:hypothetical protein